MLWSPGGDLKLKGTPPVNSQSVAAGHRLLLRALGVTAAQTSSENLLQQRKLRVLELGSW